MSAHPTRRGVHRVEKSCSPFAVVFIALLSVVFIGLPHGAMDGALAIHMGWMNRPAKAAMFLIAYVGLAAAVVAVDAFGPYEHQTALTVQQLARQSYCLHTERYTQADLVGLAG